jgi:transposase-like protein
MKTTNHPTPDELTLVELMSRFPDEATALAYFETLRWPNGVRCVHCDNADAAKLYKRTHNKAAKVRSGLWECGVCGQQFRATVGTIFEDSHVPMNKWLIAWYLICGAKKGMSAKQLQRHLWGAKGSYKTAWFMSHRIRHAMADPIFAEKLSGTVEIDETYVGGKMRIEFKNGKMTTALDNKTPVVSLVERGGTKRSVVMPRVNSANLRAAIVEHTAANTRTMTDDSRLYFRLGEVREHHPVNHSKKQYALKKAGFTAHTNTVESSFSLIKRSIVGAFHHVSKKHLGRYLAEADFKWNHRTVSDGERTVKGLRKTVGKRLTYKPLTKTAKPE